MQIVLNLELCFYNIEIQSFTRYRKFSMLKQSAFTICPICKAKQAIKIRNLRGSRTGLIHPLHFCCNCFSMSQRPDYKEDEKQLYGDLGWHIDRQLVIFSGWENILKQIIKHHHKPQTLLEVGCGIGTILQVGTNLGLSCSGIEPNQLAVAHARKRYPMEIIEGYFTQDTIRQHLHGKTFDIVVVSSVLEHLLEPSAFINDLFSVAHPGSLIYIDIPSTNTLKYIFSVLFPYSKKSIFLDNDVHINHFSKHEIHKLFTDNGAESINIPESSSTFLFRVNAGKETVTATQ